VAKHVSDLTEEGNSITKLKEKFGTEKVNKTIHACLLRYKVPSEMEYEAVFYLTRIGFLHAVSSPPVKKYAVGVR